MLVRVLYRRNVESITMKFCEVVKIIFPSKTALSYSTILTYFLWVAGFTTSPNIYLTEFQRRIWQ